MMAATPVEVVQMFLDQNERLCQLAEEAAELAQAALKLRRAYMNINPTPRTPEEAYSGLLEELADVSVCLTSLGFDRSIDRMKVERFELEKMARWAARLEELHGVETD